MNALDAGVDLLFQNFSWEAMTSVTEGPRFLHWKGVNLGLGGDKEFFPGFLVLPCESPGKSLPFSMASSA